jgi:cell division protein FtsL
MTTVVLVLLCCAWRKSFERKRVTNLGTELAPEQKRIKEKKRKRGSSKIWTLPFLAFCGVAFLLLAYLCQSAQLVRIQYEVLAQRQEVKRLSAIKADLELSVQELTSLERVERVAVQRLKMVIPEERHVIEVVWSKAPNSDTNQVAVAHP